MSKDTKKESKERRNELPGELEKAIKVTNLDIIGIFKKIEYLPDFISIRILDT